MPQVDGPPRFEQIDWSAVDDAGRRLTAERGTLLAGLALLVVAYLYDLLLTDRYLVGRLVMEPIDWVFLLAVVVLAAFGVVPVLRYRRHGRRVLARALSTWQARLAALALTAVLAAGVLGPIVTDRPDIAFQYRYNPPVGVATGVTPVDCFGEVTGSVFEQVCHGSLQAPLGTNKRGIPMTALLIAGAETTVYVFVIGAAFIVPLAAVVGVTAGLTGGRLDSTLMGYVDVQLAIPAIVLYFVGYVYWGASLLLLLATFGLFSWGGLARLVRSETLQRREAGYVQVARSLGAPRGYLARRHLLPNVTNTVVPAVFQMLALLVLVEAGVAFLGFHDIGVYSWGSTISEGLNAAVESQLQERAQLPAVDIWWVSTVPALALAITVGSLKILGDAFRDALDPRGERR